MGGNTRESKYTGDIFNSKFTFKVHLLENGKVGKLLLSFLIFSYHLLICMFYVVFRSMCIGGREHSAGTFCPEG
jgi:hypothetical protein